MSSVISSSLNAASGNQIRYANLRDTELDEEEEVQPIQTKQPHYNATLLTEQFSKCSFDKIPMYAKPPWPIWSDDDINKETWEDSSESTHAYEDPTNLILPSTIRPVQWVRPSYLFLKPTVIDWTDPVLNLVTPNAHLCELSEIMRFIISEISELYDYAMDQEVKTEGEDTVFVRNTEGSWKPWDHIYSMCKAGVKGEEPLYNHNGRYFVRLYYLGCWRKITVDDTIPILKNGLKGLPLGPNNELWPLLLTKALLKVAALSWDESAGDEIKNFSPVSCLTGWIHEWCDVKEPISSDELWKNLWDILPKYKPPIYYLQDVKPIIEEVDEWALQVGSASGSEEIPPAIPSPVETEPEPVDDKKKRKKSKKKKEKGKKGSVETESETIDSKIKVDETNKEEPEAGDAAKPDEKKGKKKGGKKVGDKAKTIIEDGVEPEKDGKKKVKDKKKKEGDNENDGKEKPKDGKGKGKKKAKKGEAELDDQTKKAKSKSKKDVPVEAEVDGQTKKAKSKSKKDVPGEAEIDDQTKKAKSKSKEDVLVEAEEVTDKEKAPDEAEPSPEESKTGKDDKKPKKKKKKGEAAEEPLNNEAAKGKKGSKKAKVKKDDQAPDEAEDTKKKGKSKKKKGKEEVPVADVENGGKKGKKKGKKDKKSKDEPEDEESKKGQVAPAVKPGTRGEVTTGFEIDDGFENENHLNKSGQSRRYDHVRSEPFLADEFKSALKEKLIRRAERIEQQKLLRDRKPVAHWMKEKVPPLDEILAALQKYSGDNHHSIISAYEINSRKDIPEIVTVLLEEFPTENAEDILITIPSFLYHPVHLSAVRDCLLAKPTNRPRTPLWKRYRWKAWAMKKGLIPMEEEHFKDAIKSVKISTPFAFKSDWLFKATIYEGAEEEEGEYTTFHRAIDEEFDEQQQQRHYTVISPIHDHDGNRRERSLTIGGRYANTSFASAADTSQLFKNDLLDMGTTSKLIAPEPSKLVGVGLSTHQVTRDSLPSPNENPISPTSHVEEGDESGKTTAESKYTRNSEGSPNNNEEKLYVNELRGESKPPEVEEVVHITPASACIGFWVDVEKLAPIIKKFCKFYRPKTTFGSCFNLLRTAKVFHEDPIPLTLPAPILTPTDEHPIEPEPEVQIIQELTDCHNVNPNSLSVTVGFEKLKTIHVLASHLNDIDGFDNGFYIFTDSWTEQELMFSLEVLQHSIIKKFLDTALEIDTVPAPPLERDSSDDLSKLKKLQNPKVNIGFYLEPWDWRHDRSSETPVLCASAQQSFLTHFSLPPGRSTFRLWLIADYPQISTSGITSYRKLEEIRKLIENFKRNQITQFTLKILSKSPIHVGTREEIQNYLTNQPVLFLKQCEIFSHDIWSLLLSFGKSAVVYTHVLKDLRKAYCPSFTESNKINKILKKVHDTFEENFVAMICEMNRGVLDSWMMLALRSLLLNPTVGKGYSQPSSRSHRTQIFETEQVNRNKGGYWMNEFIRKVKTIQRYFRGWQLRRLFQVRQKRHKLFLRLEQQVRKIALLIAQHSDSTYTHPPKKQRTSKVGEELVGSGDAAEVEDPEDKPEITLIPKPAKWAVDFLKKLMELHPMLVTIHPHAYCVPSHVKIKSMEGILPYFSKEIEWLPFCRFHVILPEQVDKWVYTELDLQVHPRDGIVMKIVDNDSHKMIDTVSTTMYIGRLPVNTLGYTVLMYRWSNASDQPDAFRKPFALFPKWKLRVISPQIQKSIWLADELGKVELVNPTKLILNRFTDYFIPDRDNCMCRYTLETLAKVIYLSFRFKPSYPHAQVWLEIRDLNQDCVLFEHKSIGAFILPSVRIEGKDLTAPMDKEAQILKVSSSKVQIAESIANPNTPTKSLASSNAITYASANPITNPSANPSSGGQSSESIPELKPAPKQRYTISIYAVESTWPFSEDDWNFTQSEKHAFWKQFMVRRRAPQTPRHIKQRYIDEENKLAKFAALFDEQQNQEKSNISVVEAEIVVAPLPEKKASVSVSDKDALKGKSKKNKSRNKKGKRGSDLVIDASENTVKRKSTGVAVPAPAPIENPPPTEVPITEEAPESRKPSLKASAKAKRKPARRKTKVPLVKKPYEYEDDPPTDEEGYKPDGYEAANVTVKLGGLHSVKISDTNKPYWILEILTSEDQEMDIKSNRRMLQTRLKQMKSEWKGRQEERLREGLSTIHHNLISPSPGTYLLSDPFVLVKLVNNLDTSPYLNEVEFSRFTYGEGKQVAQTVQSSEEVDTKEQAPDPHIIVPKTKGIGKHAPYCPPPTPTSKLKITASAQHRSLDRFPTSLAGSDFRFEKMNPSTFSLLPVNLATGSPSFLAFAKQFVPKYFTDSSSSSPSPSQGLNQTEYEGEFESQWQDYFNNVHKYEECRGENPEVYGESPVKPIDMGNPDNNESTEEIAGERELTGEKRKSVDRVPRKCSLLFGVTRNNDGDPKLHKKVPIPIQTDDVNESEESNEQKHRRSFSEEPEGTIMDSTILVDL